MTVLEYEMMDRLLSDLCIIGLPVIDVDFVFRPYSKTYYGRYFPATVDRPRPKVYVYPYSTPQGMFLPYDKIYEVGVHEMCHHLQYASGNFVRLKGVMHNSDFWKKYYYYHKRALKVLERRKHDDRIYQESLVPFLAPCV